MCLYPKCVCVHAQLLSRAQLFATPWTIARQAPLSVGSSREEYWSGLPFPSPRDLPDPGIKPRSPALQVDSLPSGPTGKPTYPKYAAAAAKSLQSCPTLCDPIDSSPPGSPVPGILQARTLEWVAISFSNAWKWKVKVKSLNHVQLLVTPWTYQQPTRLLHPWDFPGKSTREECHCLLCILSIQLLNFLKLTTFVWPDPYHDKECEQWPIHSHSLCPTSHWDSGEFGAGWGMDLRSRYGTVYQAIPFSFCMTSPPRCSLWTSVFEGCSQRSHKKGLAPAGADTEPMALSKVQKMGPRRQEMRQSGVIPRVAQTVPTCGSQSVPVPSCSFFAQTCHWKCPKGFFELSSSANGPSLPSSTPRTSPFQILGNHLLCSLRLVSSWTSWIVTVNSGPWSPLKILFNCISYMSFSHF